MANTQKLYRLDQILNGLVAVYLLVDGYYRFSDMIDLTIFTIISLMSWGGMILYFKWQIKSWLFWLFLLMGNYVFLVLYLKTH
ncbi:hypothetical protein [Streptococcus plurextorum]|uniref:hypothetical protein n=1 Tax=Streptococcus plurextorum TaxID=456876 RepID=UPI0004265C2C|nr:hypothetical protein [Streptococcus plurextorum]